MPDFYASHQQDRSLEKALTNKIIDEYFYRSESLLRAILRMCIFSIMQLDGLPVLLIECPNQAVAKRLSRKTLPLQQVVHHLIEHSPPSNRVLICYQEPSHRFWRYFDTHIQTWQTWHLPLDNHH